MAGVVASYPDVLSQWRHPSSGGSRRWRDELVARHGTPEENPRFWAPISPNSYLGALSGPIQLDHSTGDSEVPFEFSETLSKHITATGTTVELYSYPGDYHNIANSFELRCKEASSFLTGTSRTHYR